jgi:hypothetical protein
MKIKQAMLSLCGTAILAASTAASAATYTCTGPVVGLAIGPSGIITAESIAGIQWPYICYVKSDGALNTTGEICKSIYAMLLATQTSGKSVRLWFNDDLSCSTHPAWANLTGWYFGPVMLD